MHFKVKRWQYSSKIPSEFHAITDMKTVFHVILVKTLLLRHEITASSLSKFYNNNVCPHEKWNLGTVYNIISQKKEVIH